MPKNLNNRGSSAFILSGVAEKIWYTLYDRKAFASATAQTLTYFGAAGTDDLVSNFEGAGQLPAGQAFRAYELRVIPDINARADDVGSFMQNAALLWTIENAKRYAVGPVWQFPGGAGLIAETVQGLAAAAAPANIGSRGSNGVPSQGNAFKLRIPVILRPQQSFKITISAPVGMTLSATLNVHVQLIGILERNLQ